MNIQYIKTLGAARTTESFDELLMLWEKDLPIDLKREIVSSIGRSKDYDRVFAFINQNVWTCGYMDLVYQMYRTALYRSDIPKFAQLEEEIRHYFNNEVINKMWRFRSFRKARTKRPPHITMKADSMLLEGDSALTLKSVQDGSVHLMFTSPPYYNARVYSDYHSYTQYLERMKEVLIEVHRVLEDGRFAIVNVSPVITKRPGREFESIRYPIHFDMHRILVDVGFEFIDEILWIKPESSVPNRVGGYMQTRKPLSYKPNCITESVMVYRKEADFLLDKNIEDYEFVPDFGQSFDSTNCWFISPRSSKDHPAIFPEELCERVLKYYSFEGDTVLDPFAGSGTFGRVAMRMNRKPILCEKNADYITKLKKEY